MKKMVFEKGRLEYELHFYGGGYWNNNREKITLVRAGNGWAKPYQGKPCCIVKSDGDGLDLTIHRSLKKTTKLRLDYSEAYDLAILLTEYAKSDPYASKPLYTVRNK